MATKSSRLKTLQILKAASTLPTAGLYALTSRINQVSNGCNELLEGLFSR